MEEINIENRDDWNEGYFKSTSADRDDKSGNLGIGYVHIESNVESTIPEAESITLQLPFDNDVGDTSGENRTITENESPSYTVGIFGTNCISFDTGDSLTINDDDGIVGLTTLSVSLWMKSDDPSTGDEPSHHIFYDGVGGSGSGDNMNKLLRYNPDDDKLQLVGPSAGDSSRVSIDGDEVFDGDWHHVVAVIDEDNDGVLYLDGEEKDSTDFVSWDEVSDTDVCIGGHPDEPDRTFHGEIDEFLIFEDVQLSEEEVRNLYFKGHENNNFEGSYESKHLDELEGEADELTIDASVGSGETLTATVVALDSEGNEIDTSDEIDVQDGEDTYDVENLDEGDSYRVDFDLEVQQ